MSAWVRTQEERKGRSWNRELRTLLVPPIVVGVLFEGFLGHRHDYAGHYLAGYGGTLIAVILWFRLLPDRKFSYWSSLSVAPGCLALIALGAVAELTVFRIAKFDEVDFCNQSIGAVQASLAALEFTRTQRWGGVSLEAGMTIGVAFVVLGGCLAFA